MEGITLDFYGTLVEEDDAVVRATCESVARSTPTGVPASEIAARWYAEYKAAGSRSFGDAFLTQRSIARGTLAQVVAEVGSQVDVDELMARHYGYWRRPELFAETVEFLGGLDLPVCIVSDIDRDDLEAAMAVHGLQFEHVVTSEDARAYKPRPEPFRLALRALEMRPEQVLHVGDSPTKDIGGGVALGLRTAWVNRTSRSAPETTPDVEVPSLTALREWMTSATP